MNSNIENLDFSKLDGKLEVKELESVFGGAETPGIAGLFFCCNFVTDKEKDNKDTK